MQGSYLHRILPEFNNKLRIKCVNASIEMYQLTNYHIFESMEISHDVKLLNTQFCAHNQKGYFGYVFVLSLAV